MQSVLISIRPQYCELIASGKKTVEVRKSRPKLAVPFKCYIYCTLGSKHLCLMQNEGGVNLIACCDWTTALPFGGAISNGKVIGEFVCDKMYGIYYSIYPHDPPVFEELGTLNRPDLMAETCLSEIAINDYLDGETGYGWHISALHIYDKPRELSEFYHYLPDKILDNGDYDCRGGGEIVCMDMPEGGSDCEECPYGGRVYLKRPPESWRYVEELEEPCKTKN